MRQTRTETGNETTTLIWMGILFVVALVFGFFLMNKALFHYDAIVLAEAVEGTYAQGVLQPATNERYVEVIMASLVHLPFWLVGQNADISVRLTGVLFYAASVAVLFLLASRWWGYVVGLSSALLFGSSVIVLSPNSFGKVQAVSLFFLLLTFYLLARQSRWSFFGAAVAFALSLGSRESALFFLPFLIVYAGMVVYASRDVRLAAWFMVPLVVFVGVLWWWFVGSIVERTIVPTGSQIATFFFKPEQLVRAVSDLEMVHGWPVLLASLIGVLMSVSSVRVVPLFLIVWLCSSLFYFANISTYEARYLDVVLPPLFMFAAVPVEWLAGKKQWLGFVVLGFLMIAPVSYTLELLYPRTEFNGPLNLGRLIAEKTESDAVIIVQNEAPVVGYYGKRRTLGPPVGNRSQSEEFWLSVRENVSAGQNVWLLASAFSDDPEKNNRQLVSELFDFSEHVVTLDEDYHHTDIRHLRLLMYVWKLESKKNMSTRTEVPMPLIMRK